MSRIRPLERRLSRRRGQAAVETAIVLPLMVFLLLGIVQLTMMQQARLMVEYAAYNACRTGIVWNMNRDKMVNAALITLMPTFAATDTILGETDPELGRRPGILETWAKMKLATGATHYLSQILGNLGVNANIDFIDVRILNPTREMFQNHEEIDFDDYHADNTGAGMEFSSHNRRVREATRLTIRVRYLYWMRIPFANWIIHMAWMANEAGVQLTGPIDQPKARIGFGPISGEVGGMGRDAMILGQLEDSGKPFDEEDRGDLFRALWALHVGAHKYFIPLYATHTMRMQSNPYIKNLP
ncbi:MAG: pilus assembly protein [Myxococcales bacterium]|nr:pilus assembly protein [Myxococcales bacterium]